MYTEKCIWDIQFTRTWCLALFSTFYGKQFKTAIAINHGYAILESGSCTLRTSTALQIDYSPTQQQHDVKGKERKAMPAWFPPISLTWVSRLDSCVFETARQGVRWALFKPIQSSVIWLGPQTQVGSSLKDLGGNSRLTSSLLVLETSSSSLLPESTDSSGTEAVRKVLWLPLGLVWKPCVCVCVCVWCFMGNK